MKQMEDKRYLLLVRTGCEFCSMAVDLLEEKKIAYDLAVSTRKNPILKMFQEVFEWKTVPMIMEKEENNLFFIGGYTDLVERLNEG